MISHIHTNICMERNDYEAFKLLCDKTQKKKGHYIGKLIMDEVRKNIDIIRGE